jgi:hypothetical protein
MQTARKKIAGTLATAYSRRRKVKGGQHAPEMITVRFAVKTGRFAQNCSGKLLTAVVDLFCTAKFAIGGLMFSAPPILVVRHDAESN